MVIQEPETNRRRPVNQIKRYRKLRRLRQKDVALLTGQRNVATVSAWEKGYRQPSLKNALALSAAIACPLELLFFDQFRAERQNVQNRRQRGKQPIPSYNY